MMVDLYIPAKDRLAIFDAFDKATNKIAGDMREASRLRHADKMYMPEIVMTNYHFDNLAELLEFIKTIGERKHATERVIGYVYLDPESTSNHLMAFASV